MRVVHVSDLHMRVGHEDELRRALCALPGGMVLATGDVTNGGASRQFKMLEVAPLRMVTLPGNHDNGFLGIAYSPSHAARYRRFAERRWHVDWSDPPVVLVSKEVSFVLLDSNLYTESPLDLARGAIGPRQLERLDSALSKLSRLGRPVVVGLHHHPFIHIDPTLKLKNSEELMDVLKDRVTVLLFGHRHVFEVWHDRYGIPLIVAGGKFPRSPVVRIDVDGGLSYEVYRYVDGDWRKDGAHVLSKKAVRSVGGDAGPRGV